MMMSKKKIALHIFVAVFLFLYFLLSRMPASFVFSHIPQFNQFVTFGQASGKLWKGSVSEVRINAGSMPVSLGYTEWEIKPLNFLLGRLAFHIHAEKPQQSINANVELGVTRFISLTDVEIIFDAGLISQFYPVPGKLEGQFEINLKEFRMSPEGINALEGNVVIKDSRFTFNEPIDLGTYAAKLSFSEDTIKADLNDIQATVGVKGVAKLKPKSREYDINLTLLPTAQANPIVGQSLISFFPPVANGGFQITKSGQL